MPKELAKQYAPQGTEDRIYQNWCAPASRRSETSRFNRNNVAKGQPPLLHKLV